MSNLQDADLKKATDEKIIKKYSIPRVITQNQIIENDEIIITNSRLIINNFKTEPNEKTKTSKQCLIKDISNIDYKIKTTKNDSNNTVLIVFGIILFVLIIGIVLLFIAFSKKQDNKDCELKIYTYSNNNHPFIALEFFQSTQTEIDILDDIFPTILDIKKMLENHNY